ncbi:MAG: 2-oxoglutarate dehydrogenase E1 component [Chlorobi bacterium]|nr:2-oxoglutarate dehydrogenase E1 component [Chlorobiota bacterium]
MDNFSFIGNASPEAIEELYRKYKKDPASVDESFREFFNGFDFALSNYDTSDSGHISKEFKVLNLIHGYRQRGHLFTHTNPVRTRRKYYPTLDIINFGLTDDDLDTVFQAGKEIGIGPAPLKDILKHLNRTYCGNVGVEYLYIRHPEVVSWLKNKMEKEQNTPDFDKEKKSEIYEDLIKAVGFESFIHKKFPGQKRFSLEGAESLIPGLKAVLNKGAGEGVEEVIIGMSHRGRLNVLSNILNKPYERIFNEFIGDEYEDNISLGDVKYHLGYGNITETVSGKKIKVNLVPNPSHLEAVGPVAEGISRAKTDHRYEKDFNKLIPVIIHGDAAVSAQGVVYEVVQMSQLPGYKTGGTIHIVVNNQVGFTTNYLDGRSSTYSTDVAKVTRSPVFHINGDDPEAVVYALELAIEFRQRFNTDVFIDLLSYRKYGHNEGDEPRFTQPLLYKVINRHPNVRDIYRKQLVEEGIFSDRELADRIKIFNDNLEGKLKESKKIEKIVIKQFLEEEWSEYRYATDKDFEQSPETGIDKKELISLFEKINFLPEGLKFFKKVHKIIDDRRRMVKNNAIDWALAELSAYASILNENRPVRISGQDSERGTFAHRHAVFVQEDTGEKYYPLKNISKQQGMFEIYNSLLSEYGVMGFEYGYSLAAPAGLTVWEAQFGDFANTAQVIIDQYISSAEEKWGLQNGLVLYLPHGYEGQGPEHSSARIERFLQLAARNNMQIVNCTTPANFFHVLRRQVTVGYRVPLVIFTPKSLLRHPECVSELEDLTGNTRFKEVIDDNDVDVEEVKRVVFCSGKIYYDLLARKKELNARDVALIRIEQLHPFPGKQVGQILGKYKNTLLHLWVQEEPENMGAWYYIQNQLHNLKIIPVARLASGSPATGLTRLHQIGQNEIINKVFKPCHCELKNKYCGLQCVEGKTREEILKQHMYFEEPQRFSI